MIEFTTDTEPEFWKEYIINENGDKIEVTTLDNSREHMKPLPLTEEEFMRKYAEKRSWKERISSWFKSVEL